MPVIEIFAVIAAIIILGFLAELFFKKTNIPDVLVLIVVGILIGTILKWARPESFGGGSELFTTFALIFLLFQGSLNIDFKALVVTLAGTLKITVFSFILTILVVTGIMYVLTYNVLLSVLVGTMLAGTSSAIVVPLVKNVNIEEKNKLILILESAISDVLCIVGAITVIKIIQTGAPEASSVFRVILSNFALAIVVGAVVGLVYVILMNKYEELSHAYMVGIAVIIGLWAFVESPFVGASGPIACLAFGLVLGNSRGLLNIITKVKKEEKMVLSPDMEHSDVTVVRNVLDARAKSFYAEISFFVKVFFFVYLGILIDFSNPKVFLYGALLTLGIYLIRPLAVSLSFVGQKLKVMDKAYLEALIPKGLAAAVLAQLAVQEGVPGASDVANIVLSVVLLSIILTSVLVFCTEQGWFTGLWRIFSSQEESAKHEPEA